MPPPSEAIRITREQGLRVAAGQDRGFVGLHSIAEVFAALKRLPVQPRIHPVEAARIVTDNILLHF